MKVLVCGADGFLGRHIASALIGKGHEILRGVHHPRQAGDIAMDYRRDVTMEHWLPRLVGIDAVVNAVGILHERETGDFERVHQRTPEALFQACARTGIRRVIQISALGKADTPYLTSKHDADEALWRLLPEGVVVRPGLVFGRDGASTRFFLALSSLPVQGSPWGAGPIQPVHVDDVAKIVARLVDDTQTKGGLVEVPGPTRLSYGEWLAGYRTSLGLAPPLRLPIPGPLMTITAKIAGWFPGSLLSADTWAMLRAGNTGDPSQTAALLGHPMIPPNEFIVEQDREPLRLVALATWRNPLARGVLAIIWLVSAMVSAGLSPLDDSLARLAPFGLSGWPALSVLAVATFLDLAMGILTLLRPGRRLWQAQLLVVATYTLLVAWRLPAYLLEPFGPILKNLAVMALLFQLWSEEENQ